MTTPHPLPDPTGSSYFEPNFSGLITVSVADVTEPTSNNPRIQLSTDHGVGSIFIYDKAGSQETSKLYGFLLEHGGILKSKNLKKLSGVTLYIVTNRKGFIKEIWPADHAG